MKPVFPAVLAVALCTMPAALHPPVVRADELPKDTNTIKRLTPEQARRLVAEFKGVPVHETLQGGSKAFYPSALRLDGLTTLDSATAGALAAFEGASLRLTGLRSLDAEAARALAAYRGRHLILSGLQTLAAATAEALAGGQFTRLNVDNLTTLDAESAAALAAIPAWGGKLNRLQTLDARTATSLAGFKGVRLHLGGLKTLNADAAAALAAFKGLKLSFSGLKSLDADVATALATFKGEHLFLNDLAALDDATALALAEFGGRLHLPRPAVNGLLADKRFDATTARVYAKFAEHTIAKLVTLDVATAEVLAATRSWNGRLPNVTAFDAPDSVEVAAALARRQGPLRLPGLERISPKTLMALLEKHDVEIPLIDTLELIPEPDGSPNDDVVIPEAVQERQRQLNPGGG
jgi:hypothetical protein